jgi:hypothetical protein
MSDYNLLTIENNIRSYISYTDDEREVKRFNYTRVSCGAEAQAELDKYDCDFDIIVVNNDIEDIYSKELELGDQIYNRIKEKDLVQPPIMIVLTTRMHTKNRKLRRYADAVLEITKTSDDDFYSQIDSLIRRREKLSNANGFITREDKSGIAKYYFQNHFFLQIEIDSPADKVVKYLLGEKGRAVKPLSIPHLVDDAKDPDERKRKARNGAKKAINKVRADLTPLLHEIYKIDLNDAKKIREDIFIKAGSGDNLTYKYDNEFDVSTITRKAIYQKKLKNKKKDES